MCIIIDNKKNLVKIPLTEEVKLYDILDDEMEECIYIPSIETIEEKIKPNFAKYCFFVLWIVNNSEPKTDEEKTSIKLLNEIIKKRVQFQAESPIVTSK